MTCMRVIGLDLGRLMGFAAGVPGEVPESCTVELSKPGIGRVVQSSNLLAFMGKTLRETKPDLVVKEAPFRLAAFKDHGVGEDVVRSAYSLHGIVEAICHRHGIPCEDVAVATYTKHFTGTSKHGGRAKRKAAIIARCAQLRYVPPHCKDDNRCDALAVWDWASATLAKKPGAFALFGEAA